MEHECTYVLVLLSVTAMHAHSEFRLWTRSHDSLPTNPHGSAFVWSFRNNTIYASSDFLATTAKVGKGGIFEQLQYISRYVPPTIPPSLVPPKKSGCWVEK